jgi:hypothetical protein
MNMNALLTCTASGWAMIAGAALLYGVLGLTGAALIKYLLSNRSSAAHSSPPVLG